MTKNTGLVTLSQKEWQKSIVCSQKDIEKMGEKILVFFLHIGLNIEHLLKPVLNYASSL